MNAAIRKYAVDPLERAGSTFVQQFVVLALPYVVIGRALNVPWLALLSVAGFAGIISVLTSVLSFPIPKLSAGVDFVLRVAKTFLQSFLGVLVASHVTNVVHAPWQQSLLTAFPVAFLAFLKGLAAFAAPWSGADASLLSEEPAVVTGAGDYTPDLLDTPISDGAAATSAPAIAGPPLPAAAVEGSSPAS